MPLGTGCWGVRNKVGQWRAAALVRGVVWAVQLGLDLFGNLLANLGSFRLAGDLEDLQIRVDKH